MKKRKGSSLVFVSVLSGLLMLIALITGVNAISDLGVTSEEKMRTKLEFACESGLNRARMKIELSFNNSNLNNLEPFVTFQGNQTDDTGFNPLEKAFSDEDFVSGDDDYYEFKMNENNTEITVRYSIVSVNDNNSNGWQRSQGFTTNRMEIEAVAYAPEYGWISMTEDVWARRTSLFMYQVFFMNDLEILPGPNFNITGLVHTNEDLYLNSNNTLNIFTDSMTAAGDIHRGRLDSNSVSGNVNITSQNKDGSLVRMNNSDDSQNNDWKNIATEKWKGTVKDKSLGATRQEAPKLKSFEPGGYYDTNAGISIKVDTSGSEVVYDIIYGGNQNTFTSEQLGGALEETVIHDYRENTPGSNASNNKPTNVTNLDINKLKDALGYYPPNGVIYMTRDDAVPDNNGDPFTPDPNRKVSGFKLINGEELPGSTTFVSNLPVYIQGDFNVHTSTNPETDKWKPSAVVSDAITLLSNSWNDSKSNWKDESVNPGKSMPSASSTEFNLVLITGNTPTKPGQYSGGFENFPRFLENWSGKTVDISGGFIQLFRSRYATGRWSYGNYYQAPVRNWKSEPRFSSLNDLPPEFVDMFPSAAINVIHSNWKLISKEDSIIGDFNE